MSDIKDVMRQMREKKEQEAYEARQKAHDANQKRSEAMVKVTPIVIQTISAFIQGDPTRLSWGQQPSPTNAIATINNRLGTNQKHYMISIFSNSLEDISLSATVPSVRGNSQGRQLQIYSGKFDADTIAEKLNEALLEWYATLI